MYTIKAILYSYQNGSLVATEDTVYSTATQETRPVVTAHATFDLNEGGNAEFTLPYGHPLYDVLTPMDTYISIIDDSNEEVFYGRILSKSNPTFVGTISYQCEGAISFLNDSDVTPDARDSKGTITKRTMTAREFFTWCITQHNTFINDPRRQFTVGTISAAKASESREYQVSSYTATKSAIEQNILGPYGGYIRVRKSGNVRYIDWIQEYDSLNCQSITLAQNIQELTNVLNGDGFFTVLRPVGANGILLDNPEMNMLDAAGMARYGRIIKSVTFNAADTKAKLQTMAIDYKNRLDASILTETSIRMVDMHYLDGTIPKIRLGYRFNNIHGTGGTELTVAHMDVDILHPENDAFGFKNRHELDGGNMAQTTSGPTGKTSSRGGISGGVGFSYKYYTEADNRATIHTDNIEILSKNLTETGDNIMLLSRTVGGTLDELERDKAVQMYGTTLVQNSNTLSMAAGDMQVLTDYYNDWPAWAPNTEYKVGQRVKAWSNEAGAYYGYVCSRADSGKTTHTSGTAWDSREIEFWTRQEGRRSIRLLDGAAFEVDDINGVRTSVGVRVQDLQDDIDNVNGRANEIQGSALWTQRDNITGVSGLFTVRNDGGVERLVVLAGGGLKIQQNQQEFGYYHQDNLTAGIIVRKVNTSVESPWVANHEYAVGDKIKYDDGTRICTVAHTSGQTIDLSKWRTANETRITGDIITIGDDDTDATKKTLIQFKGDVDAEFASIKADYLKATVADVNSLFARMASTDSILISGTSIASNGIHTNSVYSGNYYYTTNEQGYSVYTPMLMKARIDGNSLKIWKFGDAENNPTINFSKATSLDGEWSGSGHLTVEATQNNSGTDTVVTRYHQYLIDSGEKENNDGTPYTTGNTWYVPVNVKSDPAELGTGEPTGTRILVNATSRHIAGWNDCRTAMVIPTADIGGTTNSSIEVGKPKADEAQGTDDTIYTMSVNDSFRPQGATQDIYAAELAIQNGNVVARISVQDVYAEGYRQGAGSGSISGEEIGWADAYSKVSIPGQNTQTNSAVFKTPNSTKTSNPAQNTHSLSMSNMGDNDVYLSMSTNSGTPVVIASFTHNKYNIGHQDGWSDAYNKVSIPGQNTQTNSAVFKTPAQYATSNPVQNTYGLSVTNDGDNAVVISMTANSGTAVSIARYQHNKYQSGHTQGLADEKALVRTRFGSSNGVYFIEAYENTSGNPTISGTSKSFELHTSGTGSSTSVIMTDTGGAQISNTPEISVGSVWSAGVTEGKNAVLINKGTWSGGRIEFTKSEGTANTKSVQLTKTSASWSNGTATVDIYDGQDVSHGANTGYSVTVDLPNATGFDTTAPANESFTTAGGTTYTNSSDGYQLISSGSSGTAAIVIKGAWTQGGKSMTGKNYLLGAPSRLYQKGWSDGKASAPTVSSESFTFANVSYGGYSNNADGYRFVSGAGTASAVVRSNFTNVITMSDNTTGKTFTNYFETVPTNIYRKGFSDGQNGVPAVVGFDTSAPASQSYTTAGGTTYTNNANGYQIITTGSSGTAVIVVKGTWTQNGQSMSGTNYLQGAPSRLYQQGWSDGLESISPSSAISLNSPTWYDSTASLPSVDVTLSTMGSLVNSHKNGRGYIYFNVTISGVSGSKKYRLPIGSP